VHYKLTFPLHSALIVNRPVVSLIIVSILVVAVVVIVVAMTVRVVVVVTLIPPTGVAVVSMIARPIARRAAIEAVVVSSLGVVVSPALVVTSSRLSAVTGALLLPLLLTDPRSNDDLARPELSLFYFVLIVGVDVDFCSRPVFAVVDVYECWRYSTIFHIIVYVLFCGVSIYIADEIRHNVFSTNSFKACIVVVRFLMWALASSCRSLIAKCNVYSFT